MAMDAIYGDTMSGKSKALKELIKYMNQTTGKKARVYAWDGGSETYNDDGMVDDGLIEVADMSILDSPMTVLKLVSDFWWPVDWRDPASKLAKPKANLSEDYGIIVMEAGGMGNWLLSDVPGGLAWHGATKSGFGGVKDADEGLSTMDKFDGGNNIPAEYQLQGSNALKHWQIAQRKMLTAIRETKKFPGQVMWTFHPTEAADFAEGGDTKDFGKIVGKKIIGPDVAGKKLASLIGKEFGNLFHADQVTIEKASSDPTSHQSVKEVSREYRLYTKRHHDPDAKVMTEYVAGTRLFGLKEYYVSSKDHPGDSLLQVYQAMKTIREANKNKGVNA